MSRPSAPDLIDTRRIEREYGISRFIARTLIDRGELPVVRPPGIRRVLVDRRDLERAIESWKERRG